VKTKESVDPPAAGPRLKWDNRRMPWPKDYAEVHPADALRREQGVQFAKLTKAGARSEAE